MDPVFVNYSGRTLTRHDVATLAAAHISGVTRCLGAERAHAILGETFNWPLRSFERIATLDNPQTLVAHLEQTRFAHITTL